VHLRAQETAGLDICTDGDAHYDEEVGGMSWQSYPLRHLAGFNTVVEPAINNVGAVAYPRGHILHDYLEARVFPRIVGPLGPGNLQYAAHVEGRATLDHKAGRASRLGRSLDPRGAEKHSARTVDRLF
jgi:5-methyltetrahydropteroyltriglutamate--homocysteine methyltransferase